MKKWLSIQLERYNYILEPVTIKSCFQLGINGSNKNDFHRLKDVFGLSVHLSIFPFDFLTVSGNNDHEGDVDTQIKYHLRYGPRFYLPSRECILVLVVPSANSRKYSSMNECCCGGYSQEVRGKEGDCLASESLA
ncbi:hypothetical protein RF11_13396 [Thelohanellus kitauei]|uniref:Uncharacterized protein n=1 Tax=Thelohanellus kitauei TaxID=669202 RepID=A0A0C2I513_THEKT|nr:hypothetical protein RF11_13396 [Thelohanellus kitauei]